LPNFFRSFPGLLFSKKIENLTKIRKFDYFQSNSAASPTAVRHFGANGDQVRGKEEKEGSGKKGGEGGRRGKGGKGRERGKWEKKGRRREGKEEKEGSEIQKETQGKKRRKKREKNLRPLANPLSSYMNNQNLAPQTTSP
jgi:hypothetical protein